MYIDLFVVLIQQSIHQINLNLTNEYVPMILKAIKIPHIE